MTMSDDYAMLFVRANGCSPVSGFQCRLKGRQKRRSTEKTLGDDINSRLRKTGQTIAKVAMRRRSSADARPASRGRAAWIKNTEGCTLEKGEYG